MFTFEKVPFKLALSWKEEYATPNMGPVELKQLENKLKQLEIGIRKSTTKKGKKPKIFSANEV